MKMKNEDLVEHFVDGGESGVNHSSNLRIEEGNVLVNYETPIALRLSDGTVVLNKKKYSSTTTKHQNNIRLFTPTELLIETEPKNLNKLIKGKITLSDLKVETEDYKYDVTPY